MTKVSSSDNIWRNGPDYFHAIVLIRVKTRFIWDLAQQVSFDIAWKQSDADGYAH